MFHRLRLAGPIFEFELLTTSRRGRYYAVRSGYALILLLIIWQIDQFWIAEYGDQLTPSQATRFALSIFAAIAIGQEVLVLILTPALVSGVITSEKQRKTLHYLMASTLSSFEIVFGKLLARMLHIAVFLAVGLPISSLLVLLGGVDPRLVLLATLGTASTAFFLCALSVFVSVYSKTTREALFLAYTLELIWLIVPEILRSTIGRSYPLFYGWIAPLNEWLLRSSPVTFSYSTLFGRGMGGFVDEFLVMAGLQAAAGLFLSIVAAFRLRPVFRAQSDAPKPLVTRLLMARGSWLSSRRPECGDAPMAWKERFTSRRTLLMRLVGGLAFLGIGLPLVYYAIQNFLLAFGESWSRSANDGSWSAHQHRSNLEYLIREITPLLFTLGFLGVATSAAAAITSEHEGDTWTCLTLTDLMGREVVLGKMAGAVKPGLRFLLAMLILATMGVITGSVHVLTLPFMAIEGALFLSFAAAFGIWISMSLKSTWRAQFLTVALLFLIGMLGQTALNLTKSYTPPVWPGLFPVEIAHTIVGPDALERFRQSGFVWGELQFNHFAESNAWLIVLRVIAPLIYGTLAVLLTFFSIRGFDRAAGRPKRSKSNHLITSFLKVLPKIEKPVTS